MLPLFLSGELVAAKATDLRAVVHVFVALAASFHADLLERQVQS